MQKHSSVLREAAQQVSPRYLTAQMLEAEELLDEVSPVPARAGARRSGAHRTEPRAARGALRSSQEAARRRLDDLGH